MKKVCKNFYSLFAGVLITSAMLSSCVWTPVNDLSKIRNKTSIKKISEFSVPFVFYKNIDQDFKSGSIPAQRQIGGALIAIDLENNTQSDYIFLEGEDLFGSRNLTPLKTSAGQTDYFLMNASYGYTSLRDSDTTAKQTLSKEVKIGSNWGNTSIYEPRYGLNYYYDIGDKAFLEIIDSNDKSLKNLTFQCYNYHNMKYIADNNGNYWAIKETSEDAHIIATPIFVDTAEGKIYDTPIHIDTETDPSIKDNFQILFVDEDYIFINNNPYIYDIANPKLLVFNRHDLTAAPVEIPVTEETSKIGVMFKVNGEYVIAAVNSNQKFNLHKLDVASKTTSFMNKTINTTVIQNWILQGTKLYVVATANIELIYHSIDLADSSTVSTKSSILVEDLF